MTMTSLKEIFLAAGLAMSAASYAAAQETDYITEREIQCASGANVFFVPQGRYIYSGMCIYRNIPIDRFSCDAFLSRRAETKNDLTRLREDIAKAIQDDTQVIIGGAEVWETDEARALEESMKKDIENTDRAHIVVITSPTNAYRCTGMS